MKKQNLLISVVFAASVALSTNAQDTEMGSFLRDALSINPQAFRDGAKSQYEHNVLKKYGARKAAVDMQKQLADLKQKQAAIATANEANSKTAIETAKAQKELDNFDKTNENDQAKTDAAIAQMEAAAAQSNASTTKSAYELQQLKKADEEAKKLAIAQQATLAKQTTNNTPGIVGSPDYDNNPYSSALRNAEIPPDVAAEIVPTAGVTSPPEIQSRDERSDSTEVIPKQDIVKVLNSIRGEVGSPISEAWSRRGVDGSQQMPKTKMPEPSDVSKWFQSSKALKYFEKNPNQLARAAADPVGWYNQFKEETPIYRSRGKSNVILAKVLNDIPNSKGVNDENIKQAKKLGIESPYIAAGILKVEPDAGKNVQGSMPKTFDYMQAWFTHEANIEKYGIPKSTVDVANGLTKGNAESQKTASLLYIKYGEHIGVPRDSLASGYHGGMEKVLSGEPISASDGVLINSDFTRISNTVTNKLIDLTNAQARKIADTENQKIADEAAKNIYTQGAIPGQGGVIKKQISDRARVVKEFKATQARHAEAVKFAKQMYSGKHIEAGNSYMELAKAHEATLYELEAAVKAIDEKMVMLVGNQGLNDLLVSRNPNRLSRAWTESSGQDIRIIVRDDGNFDVTVNGMPYKEGLTMGEVSSLARLSFDPELRESVNSTVAEQKATTA